MNTVSCMTANFVAREVGYQMTGGWSQGDRATNAFFQPLASFRPRFDELLGSIREMGFDAVDLWTAHLNPQWATEDHVQAARDSLRQHGLRVVSLAGAFGRSIAEFESACRLAVALDAVLLGGVARLIDDDRPAAVALLKTYGLRLGLENHSQPTAEALLARMGPDSDSVVGAVVDTGSFASHGYDPLRAVAVLGRRIVHVHLRDVPAPGVDESCRFGLGCVPLEAFVSKLLGSGYAGPLSIEHNPADREPTEDCQASFELLRNWMKPPIPSG